MKNPDRREKQASRIRAFQRGRRAEWLCALALMVKGYRICAMRYKTKGGEADIIARRKDLVIVVEVKARASTQQAVDAVTHTATRRIAVAHDHWLARQPDAVRLSTRFDIMAVQPWRWPVHLEDAF